MWGSTKMKFRDSIHLTNAWGIHFNKISRGVGKPYDEFKSIINQIHKQYTNIAVLVSGGIDSELVCKMFAKKQKVIAVAYKFLYEGVVINQHDLEYLKHLKSNNITLISKEIDLKYFWESSFFSDFLKKYRCTSPQLPIHAYICHDVSKLGYFPILPEMQPELKMFADGSFHFEEKEKDYAVVKYLKDNNIDCLESPLQCNPEILYSILTSPEMLAYINDPQGHADSSVFKREQYQEWFDIELIERPKFHGFEGSENIDNYYRKLIYDEFNYDDIRMFIPYQTLVSSLEKTDRLFMTTDPDVHVWVRKGFNPI